ncbi:MAG TPA: DUF433 domain-containing protein [Planctomycetaceae bacterium]|nr:DUF433 domain-containing protein [Planctomycetaceae bacterium]
MSKTSEPPNWTDRFSLDPTGGPGRLVVTGTRVAAEDLASLVEEGRSNEELLHRFPELTPDDIAAARQYAKVPAGLRRAAGSWSDDPQGLEKFLEWNRQQRKISGRSLPE